MGLSKTEVMIHKEKIESDHNLRSTSSFLVFFIALLTSIIGDQTRHSYSAPLSCFVGTKVSFSFTRQPPLVLLKSAVDRISRPSISQDTYVTF